MTLSLAVKLLKLFFAITRGSAGAIQAPQPKRRRFVKTSPTSGRPPMQLTNLSAGVLGPRRVSCPLPHVVKSLLGAFAKNVYRSPSLRTRQPQRLLARTGPRTTRITGKFPLILPRNVLSRLEAKRQQELLMEMKPMLLRTRDVKVRGPGVMVLTPLKSRTPHVALLRVLFMQRSNLRPLVVTKAPAFPSPLVTTLTPCMEIKLTRLLARITRLSPLPLHVKVLLKQ